MAKSDGERLEEQFSRIFLNLNFKKDVESVREKSGIPLRGFDDKEKSEEWYQNYLLYWRAEYLLAKRKKKRKIISWYRVFMKECLGLLKKYNLPVAGNALLINYIVNGNRFKHGSGSYCHIEEFIKDPISAQSEKILEEKKDRYVKLRIYRDATIEGVTDYLKRNWGFIRTSLRGDEIVRTKNRRVKLRKNSDRDSMIFEVYEQERLKSHDSKMPIDILVARVMNENEYPKVTPEIVRKVYSQQRKLRGM